MTTEQDKTPRTGEEEKRLSTAEASKILGIGPRRVRQLIARGRIPGSKRIGHIWTVPIQDGNIYVTTSEKGIKGAAWRMAERITSGPEIVIPSGD